VNFFNPREFSKRLFSGSPLRLGLHFYAPIHDRAKAAPTRHQKPKNDAAL
jgi:hypothetical protein